MINAEVKLFYYKGKFMTEFDNNKRFVLHADTIWLKKLKILEKTERWKVAECLFPPIHFSRK